MQYQQVLSFRNGGGAQQTQAQNPAEAILEFATQILRRWQQLQLQLAEADRAAEQAQRHTEEVERLRLIRTHQEEQDHMRRAAEAQHRQTYASQYAEAFRTGREQQETALGRLRTNIRDQAVERPDVRQSDAIVRQILYREC